VSGKRQRAIDSAARLGSKGRFLHHGRSTSILPTPNTQKES